MTKLIRSAAILAAILVLSGCGSSTTGAANNGPGNGSGGVSLPSGFPSDFPVFSGATVSAASSSSGQFDVAWTASGKAGDLFTWYKTNLGSADWTVQGVAGDATSGGLIDFNRKSQPNFGGTIKLSDGHIHVIMGSGCPCAPPG